MSITHPVQHWIAEITWRHVQIRRNFLYGFLANLGAPNLPPFSIRTADSYHLTWSPGKTRRPWRRGCLPLNHGILITFFYFILGYGHMTPSTFAGRMFCIFYALVGIPLCMLTLKVMGDKINELLGNFFNIISTKRQLRDRKGTKIKVMLTLTGLVLVFLFLGGTLYLSEDWSYFDGVYYCFIGKVITSYRMSCNRGRRISFIIHSRSTKAFFSSVLLRFHLPLVITVSLGKVV